MRDLAAAAQALRDVRKACRHFVHLWVMESLSQYPAAFDRLLSDVLAAEPVAVETHFVSRHTELGLHRTRRLDDEW